MAKVQLYTWSYCPYCKRAKEILDDKNIPYSETIIDGDDQRKRELYQKTGQNTVPYIFIDENFIGGCSHLEELNKSEKLNKL